MKFTFGGKTVPRNATVDLGAVTIDATTGAASGGGVNDQTGTAYTLTANDVGKTVTMTNGSSNTVTFPQDSAASIPVGAKGSIVQLGAGTTSVAAGSGATVRNNYTAAVQGQYGVIHWQKIAANTFVVFGDFATS